MLNYLRNNVNEAIDTMVVNDFEKVSANSKRHLLIDGDIVIKVGGTEFATEYPYLTKFISDNLSYNTIDFKANMFSDHRGNQLKITKALGKKWEELNILNYVVSELYPQGIGYQDIDSLTKEQFLTRLGDIFRQDGYTITITKKPLEFLQATYNVSFSSCFKPDGGEYFNSTIAYSLDTFTLLAVVRNAEGKKVGRSWLYQYPDVIIQAKSYGNYPANLRKLTREALQGKEKYTVEVNTDYPCSQVIGHCDPVYFDFNSLDISYKSSKFNSYQEVIDTQCIELVSSMCLICGETTEHRTGGACSDCDDSCCCCCCCETVAAEERNTFDGETYCEECFNERFVYCDHCESYQPSDGAYYQEANYYCYCEECFNDNFEKCEECEEYHLKNSMTETSAYNYVCEECLEDYYQCEECGEYTKDCQYIESEGYTVCDSCLSSEYEKCDCCQEYFKNTTEINNDGVYVCDSCLKEYYEECKECGLYFEIGTECCKAA